MTDTGAVDRIGAPLSELAGGRTENDAGSVWEKMAIAVGAAVAAAVVATTAKLGK
jgi:hypothetical protein